MPQLFNFGKYVLYFWSNESSPLEPVHVHINEKRPAQDGTKIWITREGKALVCHNRSQIPSHKLRLICRFIEANSDFICTEWKKEFHEIDYYC